MPQPPARKQRRTGDRQAAVPKPAPKDEWDEVLSAFLSDCRRRNLSTSTLENYSWWLGGKRLTAYRQEHKIRAVGDLTAEHLKSFEYELVQAGLTPSTVDSLHRHLKNFIGWSLREGWSGDDRALAVSGPRLEQREPTTLSRESEAMVRQALKGLPRDLALFELMLATGIRLREAANLTVDDLIDSPNGPLIRVRQGKGRKDRVVPIDTPKDRVSVRLRRYIDKERPVSSVTRAMFLSERATAGGEPDGLTADAIKTLFKRISRDSGVHVNPHMLRHTFATRSLAAGVDVMALQKALGHTTLAMVSRYVHYQHDDLLAAWNSRRD
jgi:site-specific recombinase XerD